MSNYYDSIYKSEAYSVEQAILAEELKFSKLEPLDGKFYLRILTPMLKSDEISVKQKAKLTSANYVTLSIPTYLLFQFMNVEVKTIKVPTKMNPETGNPTAYNTYNVLCCAKGTEDADSTSKIVTKKATTTTSGAYTIPKGTIFFVEFLGGQAEADKAFIIGISPFKFVEG